MKSVNPATGRIIHTYDGMSDSEAANVVEATYQAFLSWRETTCDSRAALMRKAACILTNNKEKYARLITEEMGKVYHQSCAEIEKCAWVCEYYAQHAQTFLADEYVDTDAAHSFITYQPIGMVLAVMPWNFPFWQVFRFAAPCLMAGNTGLLKHAGNVSGCALAIEEVFREAGFPQHIFRTLLITSDQVGAVIEHTHVRAVTLTGSTQAGKSVAAKAGACLKKTVLELGGSDAYLILDDADIGLAARACAESRLQNAGQSCIAAKRFIVTDNAYEAFLRAFGNEMQAHAMGGSMDTNTDLGPMASEELRDQLHMQVMQSVEQGAHCQLGGYIPEGTGAFYPPTILTDVAHGMPAYEQELFGPVAAIIRVRYEDEAIAVANNSAFGLGGAIFTQDTKRGLRIARECIDAGVCAVNAYVKSDPRLPFGGVKESGYGRELERFGIREFVNIKSVSVA